MPPPQVLQLRKLCSQQETLVLAQALLNTAATRTAPGSGHELGAGAPGLPAICALLASQQCVVPSIRSRIFWLTCR
jgi:hypothetical protein